MSYEHVFYLFPLVVGMVLSNTTQTTAADEPLVFISAFAPGEEGAIHAYKFNPETGELTQVARTADVEHPFFLAVSPDHRLARRKRVSASDLQREEVLLLDDGHCLRDQTLAICNAAGACELGDFRATSLATLVQMVEGGVGVTMLPEMAVRTHANLGLRLSLIRFGPPQPGRTVALAWRRSSPLAEHFETLARALVPTDFT